MARAFKQHILMWAALVLMSGLAVAAAVWLKSNQDTQPTTQTEQSQPDDSERTIPPNIKLREVAGGLEAPVDIAANGIEGDRRLYVVEQGGVVKVVEDGRVKDKVFLDLSEQVVFSGEQGLLGLVFDPDYQTNRYFYVNYVEPTNTGRRTVVARYTASADGNTALFGSEKRILTVDQPYTNHNGGDLNFGPDGYLYIGFGDGGSGGDPENRAQSPNTLLGKIIRIDVGSEKSYDVPEDNPFANEETYLPEIWSQGWRNPWRFSFDSQNGDMWIADVGQNEFEEVNHEPANTPGRNYGWRCYEAYAEYNTDGCLEANNYTFPVTAYEHSAPPCRASVTGGYVYRGQDYPRMDGFYFYADYCEGQIYSLDAAQATYTSHVTLETELRITSFGVDNRGELYLADAGEGKIYQIVGQR